MSSTAIQIVTPVIRELGEDPSDASTAQQFSDWIADAVAELVNEASDWRFLDGTQTITTVASTASYSLGALVSEIKAVVRDQTKTRLRPTSERSLAMYGYDIDLAGTPTHYISSTYSATDGPSIRLWPVPTAVETYTVYRVTDPASIGQNSIVELPPATFIALRHHVRSSYYTHSGETDLADRYRSQYSISVRNLQRKYAYEQDTSYVFQPRDIPRRTVPRGPRLPDNY